MRKTSSEFKTFFISEPGSFRDNKDYFGFMELDDMAIWIAADGLDSDEEKESAEIVAQSICEDFLEKPTMSRRRLKRYLIKAHQRLQAESRNVRLKASLAMIVTDYSKMIWAVSGNARCYHFRQSRLNLKSKDQSIAQLMAESGKIGDDEVNGHEEHNNLINYFGIQKKFKPYLSRTVFLNDGDLALLCTAGFWENLTNVELLDALKEAEEPETLADILEELMLEKQNEVLNNYTLATIFANKTFKDNAESKAKKGKKTIKVAALVLVAVLIVGLLVFFTRKQIQAVKTQQIKVIQQKQKELKIIANIDSNNEKGDELFNEGEYQQALKVYDGALKGIQLVKESNRDKAKQKKIQEKFGLSQSIVDADELFTQKNYQQALTDYLEADLKAVNLQFERKEIQERINKAKSYIAVLQMVAEGDSAFDQKDYQTAKRKYTQAGNIASKVSFDEMTQVLDAKVNDSATKSTEVEDKKTKAQSAKQFERQGTQKYNAHKYKEAIDFYTMAKSIYEDQGATNEIMGLQTKMQQCEKLNLKYQDAQNYEKQGDEKLNGKKYKEAVSLYDMARKTYVELRMNDETTRLDKKIVAAKDKRKWYNPFD